MASGNQPSATRRPGLPQESGERRSQRWASGVTVTEQTLFPPEPMAARDGPPSPVTATLDWAVAPGEQRPAGPLPLRGA